MNEKTSKPTPIRVSALKAEAAKWPPELYMGFGHDDICLMLVSEKNPENRIIMEMCNHAVLTMMVNLGGVLLQQDKLSNDDRLGMMLVISVLTKINEHTPSCGPAKESETPKGMVN